LANVSPGLLETLGKKNGEVIVRTLKGLRGFVFLNANATPSKLAFENEMR
jgi:hypothetical protein